MLTACSGGSSDPTVVAGDFTAYGVKGTVNGQNVTLDLSGLGNCATNIENMVIGINANGASISPDPRVARDYSQPVQFTLTAPDGTKVVYTVTVKGAACLSSPTPTPTPAPTPTPTPNTPFSMGNITCTATNIIWGFHETGTCTISPVDPDGIISVNATLDGAPVILNSNNSVTLSGFDFPYYQTNDVVNHTLVFTGIGKKPDGSPEAAVIRSQTITVSCPMGTAATGTGVCF